MTEKKLHWEKKGSLFTNVSIKNNKLNNSDFIGEEQG